MKIRLTGATFVAASKTVTHTSFSDVTLAGIQLITNVTDNIVIYNFADPTKGGSLATDTLTLDYDTTTMSDTDELMILVEDSVTTQPISASSLPLPTGAATSAKQDTGNTSLSSIDGKITAVNTGAVTISTAIPAGTNNIGDVDVLTVPADPFGANADAAATAGSTGSIQAKLRLLTSQIDSVKTAVEILDNAISGSEMQVDVVGALPAGTNAIGKLAANSGVDIGDVTLTAGTAAIGTLLPPDVDVTTHTNYARKYYTSAGAATDGIVWSPAAGKRWHVVALYFQVSAAATVTFEDDKGAGDDPVLKGEYAANGGAFLTFPDKYPMASGEDAADLLVTTSAGNIYVMAIGYEI